MNAIQKFFGHLRTVNRHRRMVRKLCFKCGLYCQGLIHDLSKYSPCEFINGVRFYTGTMSPHVKERKTNGYSIAWMHHVNYGNRHHPEFWCDNLNGTAMQPVPMPKKYLVEMICDRVAASMIYLGDEYTDSSPLDYYRSHRWECQMHDDTRNELEYWLFRIANEGVEPVLADIKKEIKEGKIKNET